MEEQTNFEDVLTFVAPKEKASYIKVFGVGGGGSNAVNHMYRQGIKGVDFIVCNTDAQALDASPVPVKIQIGKGLGAGNIPAVASEAAIEKHEEIKSILSENTQMLFITAGMGGGTGTGAAPVIASIAKEIELDDEVTKILTVAIVTTPFSFEGVKRKAQAQNGIAELRKYVDAILVINNDKLRDFGKMSMKDAFAMADNVLTTAARGISEIITVSSYIQIDFKDVNTVMSNSGVALMGCGSSSGENRAKAASLMAMDSPLLNDNSIEGAKNMLLYISYGTDAPLLMDEIETITSLILSKSGSSVDLIWGAGEDASLGEGIALTLIATGFNEKSYSEPVKVKLGAIETDGKETINESSPFVKVQDTQLSENSINKQQLRKNVLFLEEETELDNPIKAEISTSVEELPTFSEQKTEVATDSLQATNPINKEDIGGSAYNEPKMERTVEPLDIESIADSWFLDMQNTEKTFAAIEDKLSKQECECSIEKGQEKKQEPTAVMDDLVFMPFEDGKSEVVSENTDGGEDTGRSWIEENITAAWRGEHAGFSSSEIEEVSNDIELIDSSERLRYDNYQTSMQGNDVKDEVGNTIIATANIQTKQIYPAAYQERMNRMKRFKDKLESAGGLRYLEDIPACKRKEMTLDPEIHSSESEVGSMMITADGRITSNAYLKDNEKVD